METDTDLQDDSFGALDEALAVYQAPGGALDFTAAAALLLADLALECQRRGVDFKALTKNIATMLMMILSF